jgi:hypothetical protein
MLHEVNDKDSEGKIILLLFLSAVFFSGVVILIDGLNIALMWIVGGAPLLVMIGLTILRVLERFGVGPRHFEWLFPGLFLVIWLAGLFLIIGFKHGLSVRKATLFALLLFVGAGVTLNYARCMVDASVLSQREGKLIVISCVIAILWGVSLFWIPSSRLVIVDWPCREAEWRYEDAEPTREKAFKEWQACMEESNE